MDVEKNMSLPGLASSMKFRWGLQVFGDSFTGMFSPLFSLLLPALLHSYFSYFFLQGGRSRKRSNWIRRHGESTDEGERTGTENVIGAVYRSGWEARAVKRSQTERVRRTLRRKQLV